MDIFERSRQLVYDAEHIVLGGKPPVSRNRLHRCIDVVLVGPWFVLVGVQQNLKRLAVMACIAGLFYALMRVFGPNQNVSVFWPAVWMASMVLTFGLPSIAGTSGVKTERVGSVARCLEAMAPNLVEMQRVKEGVDLIRKQSLERITRVNWALGIAWAAVCWFYTNQVFQSNLAPKVVSDHIGLSLPFLFAFGFFGLGALCYEEAVKALYQTIDFAFLEAKARGSDPFSNSGCLVEPTSTALVGSTP